jgi:DNA polymerase elongation subunit (family B)
MEALKHYFGITQSNELIARGIEVRRHDAPNFIKEFQTELLYTLFDCKDSAEVFCKGYDNALLLVTKTINKVMTGEIQIKDLYSLWSILIYIPYRLPLLRLMGVGCI